MKRLLLLPILFLTAACKKDPDGMTSTPGYQLSAGPGDIGDSKELDVDADGSMDLKIEIVPAPHSATNVFLKCLHAGIGLEVRLEKDSNYIHYNSVIPDPAKKVKIYPAQNNV